MNLSRSLLSLVAAFIFSFVGCGGSNKPTSVDSSELQNYVQDNAAALEAEDAALEAEEAEDDD